MERVGMLFTIVNTPEVFDSFMNHSAQTGMTEMQAAIGRVQLQRLPSWVERRRENANQIMEGLAGIEGLRFSKPLDRFHHSYYRLYGFIDPTF